MHSGESLKPEFFTAFAIMPFSMREVIEMEAG